MNCFQPLFAFVGSFPIIARLRTGKAEPADDALEKLRAAVKIIRKSFPKLKIYFRADAGFARPELYEYCEKNQINKTACKQSASNCGS